MSSKPRIIAPNLIYQVSSEGIKEIQIFGKEEIRMFFLDQLAETIKKYNCTCLSFSITKNQYHIVIKTGEESISKAIQRLNSVLAKKVNKLTGRQGVAFKSRFKSVIVEEGDFLKELIRFVHMEPVNKSECSFDELKNYKWSSHSFLLRNDQNNLICIEESLKYFGSQKEYLEFMCSNLSGQNDKITEKFKNVNIGMQDFQKKDLWIIGKPEFIQDTLDKDRCRRLRIARHQSENVEIEGIHTAVENLLNLDIDAIYRQGRSNVNSTARELFVFIGKYRYDFTGTQLARYLKITESAISKMITRFNNINNNEYLLRNVIVSIS